MYFIVGYRTLEYASVGYRESDILQSITIVFYSRNKTQLNANVVYQVAEALPLEEQLLLFDMLQKKLYNKPISIKKKKEQILTKEEAVQYLLKNVFNKK